MAGILDQAFETIGKAAKPLKPVTDFMMPDSQFQGGQELSIGNLINSAGRGIQNSIDEGLVGLGAAGYNAVTMKGMSGRQRLLMMGMVGLGTAMSARAIHHGWKANRAADGLAENTVRRAVAREAPAGYGRLQDLGDPSRFVDLSDEAQALLRDRPGISRRQAQIMASNESLGVARGIGRWKPGDPARESAAAALFDGYSRRLPEGAPGAQADWARFDLAYDSGIFAATKGNSRVRELWKTAIENPQMLEQADADELYGFIQSFADKTDGLVNDDLSVGMAGRIVRSEFVDGDAHIFVNHPYGWNDGRAVEPLVRAQRLRQLNHRNIAGRGKAMLHQLWDIGKTEFDRYAKTGETRLPEGMRLGPDWYPVALDDVVKEFGLNVNSSPAAVDRAVAAVSFLSEAEDWSTNIVKARKVLERAGDISDPDFQAWLRDNVQINTNTPKLGRHKYTGSRKAARNHAKRFDEIWSIVKEGPPGEQGFKVDETTMKKILRLYGGVETVEDVFRSTKSRKQRNFYLNIRHPEDDWPVTIDRHAYDAFLGMDSGIQDRPIDQSLFDGDEVYDVVADTYRSLANELGVKPHELQAVIWEAWRMLKGEHPKNGWKALAEGADAPSPFMMTLPDETVNPVFDAITGRNGLTGGIGAAHAGPIPADVLTAKDAKGLTAVAVGEEAVILADVDDITASVARTQYPGVVGADRVPRWVDVQPVRAENIDSWTREVQGIQGHHTETVAVSDMPGGLHPALRPETTIVGYLDDGVKLSGVEGTTVTPAGRATTQTQELNYTRLGPDDIDPARWTKPDSPMKTHAWAAISAELDDTQVGKLGLDGYDPAAATNELRIELQKRGFKPIEVDGFYGGSAEKSFLVFGMSPQEARVVGELFGQESIITNDGFLYNRAPEGVSDPTLTGAARDATGIELDPKKVSGEDFYRSELKIGRRRLKFAQSLDWENTRPAFDESLVAQKSKNRRRVEITVQDGADLDEVVTKYEGNGLQDPAVYSNTDRLPGFERAYERVASDGNTFVTSRTRSGRVADPHGGQVFVRSASGLSDPIPTTPGWKVGGDGIAVAGNTLRVDGRFPNGNVEFTGPFKATRNGESPIAWGYQDGTLTPVFDEAELVRFDAVVEGNRIRVNDEADVTPAITARTHLVDAGFPDAEKLKLKTAEGTFDFAKIPETRPQSEVLTTKNGLHVRASHRDYRPGRLERNYGIIGDYGWREGNQRVHLDDGTIESIEQGVGLVFNDHENVIHRARLRELTTENMDPADAMRNEVPYAYFGFAPDSKIVLTREFFGDPQQFERMLRGDREARWLSSRVEPTPASIVVHELGHVIHLSARMGEGLTKSSPLEKEIIRMLGGSRKWSGVAFDEIGHVASTDISELIAESVSEVMMASKPSKLAKDVYDVVTNSLDEYMKYHDLKPDVSPTRVTAMASSAPEGVVTDPKFWGGGMEAMFPAQGAPAIPAPFPSVGKNKTYQAFDQDIVNAAVARGETTMIDPRTLWATQPKVTEDGVRHYMNSDELYADAAQAGNKYPVIYRRNEGNRTRNLILSGTHRSAAALAKGEQLEAIVVDGPWGPKR